ncbi:MAG: twin-arginine translocase TatA/TatE family subunit [Bacteroidetes bacterium]|nr:twin-arginine translocase TatA/TatE family subunit [Bacteroidota bacterium]
MQINSTLLFLNLGGGEVFVVVFVIVLFFGSKRIPELARGLGRGIREFKDAASGIQKEIQDSANVVEEEVKKIDKDHLS